MRVPGSTTVLTLLAMTSLQEFLLAAPTTDNAVEGNLGSLADESVLENSALAPPLTRQRRYGHDFSGESCHFPGHHGHRGHHGHHPHGPPRFGFGWHESPPHPPPFGFDPLADNSSPDQQVPQYKAPLAPFNDGDLYNPAEEQASTPIETSSPSVPISFSPSTTTSTSTSTSTSSTTSSTTAEPRLDIDVRFGTD